MNKVLIIVHDFPGSGGARFTKLLPHLQGLGYEPLVLTVKGGQQRREAPAANPAGKIRVFRTMCLRKSPFRVFSKLFSSWSLTTYFESLLFIPDLFVTWVPSAVLKGLRLIKEERVRLIITTSPPESTHITGLLLKRLTGVPWIADFQDLWTTKRMVFHPPSPLHDVIVKGLERVIYAECDHLIANTHGNKRLYQELFGIGNDRITVVPNGYDREEQGCLHGRVSNDNPGEFSIGYMGYFDKNGFPWREFLEALRNIPASAGRAVIRLHVAGHMSQEAKRNVCKLGLEDRFVHHGNLPHSEAFRLIAQCDLLLLLMYETSYSKAIVPHKLYYYLAMSKPIIAIAEEAGEVSEIIRKANAGQVFPIGRIGEAARAISDRFHEWSVEGRLKHAPDTNTIAEYEYGTLAQTLTRAMNAVLVDGAKGFEGAHAQPSETKESKPRKSPPEPLLTTPETK